MTYLLATLAGSAILMAVALATAFIIELSNINISLKEKAEDYLVITLGVSVAVPVLGLATALSFHLAGVAL